MEFEELLSIRLWYFKVWKIELRGLQVRYDINNNDKGKKNMWLVKFLFDLGLQILDINSDLQLGYRTW